VPLERLVQQERLVLLELLEQLDLQVLAEQSRSSQPYRH